MNRERSHGACLEVIRSWVSLLGAAVALSGMALAACFSGREGTGPIEGVCNVELGEGLPGSTVVVIRGFTFQPAEVQISPGERITWINCDPDQHTSTADGGQWSSPLLAGGEVFTTTFSSGGECPYHCEPHPFMIGRIVVQ